MDVSEASTATLTPAKVSTAGLLFHLKLPLQKTESPHFSQSQVNRSSHEQPVWCSVHCLPHCQTSQPTLSERSWQLAPCWIGCEEGNQPCAWTEGSSCKCVHGRSRGVKFNVSANSLVCSECPSSPWIQCPAFVGSGHWGPGAVLRGTCCSLSARTDRLYRLHRIINKKREKQQEVEPHVTAYQKY